MTELQRIAVAGVLLCITIVLFIIANMMVVYCINRERDKRSYYWMAISFICLLLAIHLAKYV